MPVFPKSWSRLRVELCHDWLTGMRGGERVLEILCDGFPDAPVHTLLHDPGSLSDRIEHHPIRTSWLQHIPGIARYYRNFLPLMPWAVKSLRHSPAADLVLSTSHCVAKSIPRRGPGRHLCYCFTPMRYAWLFHGDYFGANPLKRALYAPLLAGLRHWDRATAPRVDRFVAISNHVRERIRTFYGRDADVVYPPADTDYFTPAASPSADYDLIVSALVPYKRVELAIQAYAGRKEKLRIIGSGTEYARLREMAGKNIEFMGRVPDEAMREHIRNCRLLVFPGEEDFGIVPVEAMACGRPVVAFGRGGVTETVVDRVTGVFFPEATPASLSAALDRAEAATWNPAVIRARALQFSVQTFINGMERAIRACLDAPPVGP